MMGVKGSCFSSVLLCARFEMPRRFSFLSSFPFPSISPSIPCMSRESRKFTLEGASSNRVSRRTVSASSFSRSPSPERARSESGGWKFTRHGFRSSFGFAPRSYGSRRSLERTAQIEISRLDTSTSVIPAERKASLLSRDLSVVLITLSLRSNLSPRPTFHVYIAIVSFMKSRVFFFSLHTYRVVYLVLFFIIFLLKERKLSLIVL